MNAAQIGVVAACTELSAEGGAGFGEIVRRLAEAGVERYHADYSRRETTYYAAGGGSHVVAMAYGAEVGGAFSAEGVKDAVRRAQRGELKHPEFVTVTAGAGCVGYFVQIAGGCVQYFGRRGEVHVEVMAR